MPYFQVVFTIPDTLSSLVLGNRRELYNLLFRSAWNSLNQSIRKENRQQASAAMVLHTWNQKLEHHPHVLGTVSDWRSDLGQTADRRIEWQSRILGQRRPFLQLCGKLRDTLGLPAPIKKAEIPKQSKAIELKVQVCPKCESAMELESSQQRPSWRILFTGPEHPEWCAWMESG